MEVKRTPSRKRDISTRPFYKSIAMSEKTDGSTGAINPFTKEYFEKKLVFDCRNCETVFESKPFLINREFHCENKAHSGEYCFLPVQARYERERTMSQVL